MSYFTKYGSCLYTHEKKYDINDFYMDNGVNKNVHYSITDL